MLLMGRPVSVALMKSSHRSRSSRVYLVRGWGPWRQCLSKRHSRLKKCRLVGMTNFMWLSRPISKSRLGWETTLVWRILLMVCVHRRAFSGGSTIVRTRVLMSQPRTVLSLASGRRPGVCGGRGRQIGEGFVDGEGPEHGVDCQRYFGFGLFDEGWEVEGDRTSVVNIVIYFGQ
eukprot:6782864-Ditylum_brightwellii.AAC.1